MDCTILQFIIVCPMVFLAGFVDAIAGGGGLISLPAYLIAGVPTHMALGTNKMSSMMGTAIATGRFAKNGYIQFKKVVWHNWKSHTAHSPASPALFSCGGTYSGLSPHPADICSLHTSSVNALA